MLRISVSQLSRTPYESTRPKGEGRCRVKFPLWNPLCLQSEWDDIEDLYRSFLRATAHTEVTLEI